MKTVRYINSRIWERKRGNYTEALVEFQVSAIFNMRDIWRNDLPIFILELCMEPAPYWYPSGWAQSALWATTCLHAGRNPQKHLLLRLLMDSSLEELDQKHYTDIKVVLFVIQ